jgi:hypothetical protein
MSALTGLIQSRKKEKLSTDEHGYFIDNPGFLNNL